MMQLYLFCSYMSYMVNSQPQPQPQPLVFTSEAPMFPCRIQTFSIILHVYP